MTNQLIPLAPCVTVRGEYEPAIVGRWSPRESLESAMSYRAGSYTLRPDLRGKVHSCACRPIISLPHPQLLCAVENAPGALLLAWSVACAED